MTLESTLLAGVLADWDTVPYEGGMYCVECYKMKRGNRKLSPARTPGEYNCAWCQEMKYEPKPSGEEWV